MDTVSKPTPPVAGHASLEALDARIRELEVRHWHADDRIRELRIAFERADRHATNARRKADTIASDVRMLRALRDGLETQLYALKLQAHELREQDDR